MKSKTIIWVALILWTSSVFGCSKEEEKKTITTTDAGSTTTDAGSVASSNCVGNIAWYSANSSGTALEIGKKAANKFSLYDMLGNAVEWVADCYHETYASAPTNGEIWDESSCAYRVIRGGCYGSTAKGVRVSVRESAAPNFYGACAPGIRCVRTSGTSSAKDAGTSVADSSQTNSDAGKTPVTLSWVQIPAGSFQMGCSQGDDQCSTNESPSHTVTVAAFEMTKYEVTQLEYVNQTGETPSSGIAYCPACAMTYVSWDKAKAFCEAVGGRLPTEAEWEYAARGGTTTRYYCGN